MSVLGTDAAGWQILLALVVGALLGSIPFGLLLTRAAGLGDIRKVGSGNIGATNVLRTGRKGLAAATLLLDGAKGAAAVLVAIYLIDSGSDRVLGWLAGLAAVLGHCHSIWLAGKGGKGVAAGLGVLLAGAWPVGVACCAAWLAVAALARRSSAASLASLALAPVLVLVWPNAAGGVVAAVIVLVMSAQIYFAHRENIARLLAGTEPRIGASK